MRERLACVCLLRVRTPKGVIAMRSRIDGKALRLANSAKAQASAIAGKASKAVTAKGQRNAVAKVAKVKPFSKDALLAWHDSEVWARPLSLTAWALEAGFGQVELRSLVEATKSDNNAEAVTALRILDGYRRYTSKRFAVEFEFANFERLVRIEEASQRQGGINLGLAGYSPADIVQMAVVRAWARSVAHALLSTKAVPAGEAETLRVALSKRSMLDFEDALEAREVKRYRAEVTASGKVVIRFEDVSAKVSKVASLAEAFERAKSYSDAWGFGAGFTIGEVQREIKKVKREGVKEITRMLEGLTFDGTFTASVEASVSERESYGFRSQVEANLEYGLTSSVEDDFIRDRFEVVDERAELIAELKALDLTPAEADALTLVELLHAGESLDSIRNDVFDDLSDRKFAQVITASQDLVKLIG